MGTRRAAGRWSSGRRAGNQSWRRSSGRGDARDRRRRLVSERPGKAQLMPVGVGDVEKTLAPFGIARRAVGPAAGGDQPGMKRVDIGVVQYEAAPPRPAPPGRLEDQVEKIVA